MVLQLAVRTRGFYVFIIGVIASRFDRPMGCESRTSWLLPWFLIAPHAMTSMGAIPLSGAITYMICIWYFTYRLVSNLSEYSLSSFI